MAAPNIKGVQPTRLHVVPNPTTDKIRTNDTVYELGPGSTLGNPEHLRELLGTKVLVRAVDSDGNMMRKRKDPIADQQRWKQMDPHAVRAEIGERRKDERNGWRDHIAPVVGTLVTVSEYAAVIAAEGPRDIERIVLTDDVTAGVQVLHPVLAEAPAN